VREGVDKVSLFISIALCVCVMMKTAPRSHFHGGTLEKFCVEIFHAGINLFIATVLGVCELLRDEIGRKNLDRRPSSSTETISWVFVEIAGIKLAVEII
jgi:hypothetical protein